MVASSSDVPTTLYAENFIQQHKHVWCNFMAEELSYNSLCPQIISKVPNRKSELFHKSSIEKVDAKKKLTIF